MNKERRKRIQAVREAVNDARCDLEEIRDDELACFDNLPESIQDSDRGADMQESIDHLEQALDSLESALDSLDENNF